MNDRIKFSGHTMGAPQWDIYQVIKEFKKIGYDGIEVRVAADGQINSETITDAECRKIRAAADKEGMEFSCLVSYYQNFVNLEMRDSVIKNLKRVAEIAHLLHCPLIRVYGGVEPFSTAIPVEIKDAKGKKQTVIGSGTWFCDCWSRTVSGIREVAKYAATLGVGIAVETHVGSITMSIRDTVRLIQDINMANVGILFDYAWVELAGVESGAQAVYAAAPYIVHCHVKDWTLEQRFPIKKKSCLMGKGTVRWAETLTALKEVGYTGYVSDEYEKYWYPKELPSTEDGMGHNLNFVKSFVLGETKKAAKPAAKKAAAKPVAKKAAAKPVAKKAAVKPVAKKAAKPAAKKVAKKK